MEMARRITSLILSIRRKEKAKVRQPLGKAMVAILDPELREELVKVQDVIKGEVNVKELEYISEDNSILVKKIKPNFRALGPKVGPLIKKIGPALGQFTQDDIRELETTGKKTLILGDSSIDLDLSDVEILSEDIPGWSVASEGGYTVALDITLDDALRFEGIAREFVNRIQNLRKSKGFEVTDRIEIKISQNENWDTAVEAHKGYISSETLANTLSVLPEGELTDADALEINGVDGKIELIRL